MISVDCETLGVDRFHGATPFYVSLHPGGDSHVLFWEWSVNPLTRKVSVPDEDIQEIQSYIDSADVIITHNGKFDRGMLSDIGITVPIERMQDTLIASHLLESNRSHDLTRLTLRHLLLDIEHLEKKLERAVQECRRYCRTHHPEWAIGKKGLRINGEEVMPSADRGKGCNSWKADYWLPKALADYHNLPANHEYRTVLRQYANADAEVLPPLWCKFERDLKQQWLWEIYLESMRLPDICLRMEERGVTISGDRLDVLEVKCRAILDEVEKTMVGIAAHYGVEMEAPRGISNKLRSLVENTFKLTSSETTDNGNPGMNKNAIRDWLLTLDKHSMPYEFIRCLSRQRKAIKDLEAIESYQRYARGLQREKQYHPATPSVVTNWHVLHPSINQTGSDTLRFSFSNPNSANVGKTGSDGSQEFSLRYAFGPAPGREWWSFDFENIELRIPAYLSKQQELIDLFERSDQPPFYGSEHILNFSMVYEDLWEDALRKVGPEKVAVWIKKEYKDTWYQWCKNGDFAVQYQAGDKTADKAFHRIGARRRLKERFARKEELNQYWIRFAVKYGYVETIPDRTVSSKRGYQLLCTRNDRGNIMNTVPLSYMVQGTAMQCTRKAMMRVDDQLRRWNEKGFDGHIVLQVHDELDLDFPKGKSPESNLLKARVIRRLMEMSGDDIGIPLKVAITYHPDNWSEGVIMT